MQMKTVRYPRVWKVVKRVQLRINTLYLDSNLKMIKREKVVQLHYSLTVAFSNSFKLCFHKNVIIIFNLVVNISIGKYQL